MKIRKALTLAALLSSLAVTAWGQTPAAAAAPKSNPQVELTTSKGVIVLELEAEKAPNSVANFLSYVDSGFYNGLVFHRVIERFMIQGGGFDAALTKKDTKAPIQNEADNGLHNGVGTIAMARTGDPHSATAQFFINTVDNKGLDHRSKDVNGWGYTVFGKVISGMDVVQAIAKVPTGVKNGMKDVPNEPVTIVKAARKN